MAEHAGVHQLDDRTAGERQRVGLEGARRVWDAADIHGDRKVRFNGIGGWLRAAKTDLLLDCENKEYVIISFREQLQRPQADRTTKTVVQIGRDHLAVLEDRFAAEDSGIADRHLRSGRVNV